MAKKKITQTPAKAVPAGVDIVPLVDMESVPPRTKHATWSQVITAFGFLSSADLSGFATEDYVDTALTAKQDAGDYAHLVGGKVPADELPSYVDDVLEYANFAAFPVTGETGKIYLALNNGRTYRWSGTVYVEINPGLVTSVAGRTGDVALVAADVADFAAAVAATQPADHPHGNITNDGKIGATGGLFVVTGTGGVLTTQQLTGEDVYISDTIDTQTFPGDENLHWVLERIDDAIEARAFATHTHGAIANDGTIGQTTLASDATGPQTVTFPDASGTVVVSGPAAMPVDLGSVYSISGFAGGTIASPAAAEFQYGLQIGGSLGITWPSIGMQAYIEAFPSGVSHGDGTHIAIGNVAAVIINSTLEVIGSLVVGYGGNSATLDTSSLSAARTITFPDADGTVVLFNAGSDYTFIGGPAHLDSCPIFQASSSYGCNLTPAALTTARTYTLPDADGTVVLTNEGGATNQPATFFDAIGFKNGSSGFVTQFGGGGDTENRTITLPDASGTVVLQEPSNGRVVVPGTGLLFSGYYGSELNLSLTTTGRTWHMPDFDGVVVLNSGSGISFTNNYTFGTAVLDTLATGTRTYTLPDADGTVALEGHGHGPLASDGKLGSEGNLLVTTGADGTLTPELLSDIEDPILRAKFLYEAANGFDVLGFVDGAVVWTSENTEYPRLFRESINAAGYVGVPSGPTDEGQPGQIAVDVNYLYVCVAADTWKRVALATW